ncbi:hypothetical protein NW754_002745 [Fusarium falciforme]|nr:hypothetical protein NW754_002745 [Fusarium falciforme]
MYFSKLAISMLAATGAVAHPHARRAAQNDVVVVEYVTKVVTEYGSSQPTYVPQRQGKQHSWWQWKPSQPEQAEQPAQTTVVVEAPQGHLRPCCLRPCRQLRLLRFFLRQPERRREGCPRRPQRCPCRRWHRRPCLGRRACRRRSRVRQAACWHRQPCPLWCRRLRREPLPGW